MEVYKEELNVMSGIEDEGASELDYKGFANKKAQDCVDEWVIYLPAQLHFLRTT